MPCGACSLAGASPAGEGPRGCLDPRRGQTMDAYLVKVCHSLNRALGIIGSAWITGSARSIACSSSNRFELIGLYGALLLYPRGNRPPEQGMAASGVSWHQARPWCIFSGSGGGGVCLQCCSVDGSECGNGCWISAKKFRLLFKTLSLEVA